MTNARDTLLNVDVELFDMLVSMVRGSKVVSLNALYEKFFNVVFSRSSNESFLREEARSKAVMTSNSACAAEGLKAFVAKR